MIFAMMLNVTYALLRCFKQVPSGIAKVVGSNPVQSLTGPNIRNKNKTDSRRGSRSLDNAEFGHLTLLFCSGPTEKKCTKNYNARAQHIVPKPSV